MDDIPNLNMGERWKYVQDKLERTWTVYYNEQMKKFGMQLEGHNKDITDTALHMFNWENMIKI